MIKLFYSGTYCAKHKLINESNVYTMLKNDIRSKLVGNVKDVVYASDGVVIKGNKNVIYIGGFYYENQDKQISVCENVVLEELKQIDKCDLVVANLMHYSAIATVTEIMYAAFKNKKIVVFCNPKITNSSIESEYWFPIYSIKKICNNVEIKYISNEEEIVDYVNSLRE